MLTQSGVWDWLKILPFARERGPATGRFNAIDLCGKKSDGSAQIYTSAEFTALGTKTTGEIYCVEIPSN